VADPHAKHPGRNEPCHCGSGKKYKHCCLEKDEEADRAERAQKASAEPPPPPPEPERAQKTAPPKRTSEQPWRQKGQATRPFQKVSTPRKVGSS
jgi:hypothetical protein